MAREGMPPSDIKHAESMTLAESERIIDLVAATLIDQSQSSSQRHPSVLQGFTMFDVIAALRLRIANEFLASADQPDGEAQFQANLMLYDRTRYSIASAFQDYHNHNPLDSRIFGALKANTFELNPVFRACGTCRGFAEFCKTVGPNEPSYWQIIYRHCNLAYTSDSPQGNLPYGLDYDQ